MEFVLVLIYFLRIQLCKTTNNAGFLLYFAVQYIFAKYLLEFFVDGNLMPADVKR